MIVDAFNWNTVVSDDVLKIVPNEHKDVAATCSTTVPCRQWKDTCLPMQRRAAPEFVFRGERLFQQPPKQKETSKQHDERKIEKKNREPARRKGTAKSHKKSATV